MKRGGTNRELTPDDREALKRSAEDVRSGRFAADEDVKRVFDRYRRKRRPAMTKEQINAVLEGVRSWPEEDQAELMEIVREIEARRAGSYRATPEELRAIDEADRSGIATDKEVEAAFRAFRNA
jgi:hypothetical protein